VAKTTWTDTQGRTWSARMTIAEANRLKAEESIDLLDPESLKLLIGDPLAVVGLICAVHAPQINEAGLTRGDFAEVCTETERVASDAADALVEALADFFGRLRKPALATLVKVAMQTTNAAEQQVKLRVETKGRAMMESQLAIGLANLDAAIASAHANAESHGKPSGNIPES